MANRQAGIEVVLHAAVEQVVAGLRADTKSAVSCVGRQVGAADVPHLALSHQFPERRDGLLQRSDAVRLVVLVQVDPVGAEPAQ